VGCAAIDNSSRIDNIPMYGQPTIERPVELKKADEAFIATATKGFGTREKASQAWFAEGEKYMSQGNFDYAMRRYNQSWLLNPKNYQPYWGFARVSLQERKVDDSIKYFEIANQFINDPYQQVALLTDFGSAYSNKGDSDPSYFEKANKKFSESIKLDPTYSESYRRWAISLYHQGDYKGAWQQVKKARKLNAKPFPASFISDLESKLPEPK
jgi:tetratricopeptide (TPR) repeat protein